jgi:hypothetical protein
MLKGRLHGAFWMCVFISDKPFVAEACDIGGYASATNGLSDIKTPSKTHRVIDPLCRQATRCSRRNDYYDLAIFRLKLNLLGNFFGLLCRLHLNCYCIRREIVQND